MPEKTKEENYENNKGVIDAEVTEVALYAHGGFSKGERTIEGVKSEDLLPWAALGENGLSCGLDACTEVRTSGIGG